MANPQPVVEIARGEAPVQEVVFTGEAIDLARLPFHMQHQYDGAPYLSSAIDYAVDPARSSRFDAAIRRWWPGLPDDALAPAYSGVRPKLRASL